MTRPDDAEVRYRVRAALSGFTLGVEQWPMMLLDEDDRMTDKEKIDYLIGCCATSLAYCNLMVQCYARAVRVEPGEVLSMLYQTIDDTAGGQQ